MNPGVVHIVGTENRSQKTEVTATMFNVRCSPFKVPHSMFACPNPLPKHSDRRRTLEPEQVSRALAVG